MSLLILKEKHGDRHFSFNDLSDLELTAAHIVRERNEEGWYEDTSNKYLRQALSGDNKAALGFLKLRQTFEYEDFELIEPETIKGVTI